MTLGERIKRQREAKGMTLLQLAEKIGVSEATMQRYESGRIKNPKQPRLVALTKALDVDANYLMDWRGDIAKQDFPDDVQGIEVRRIPLLGEIAAGTPILAGNTYEYIDIANAPRKADAAIIVKGNSMYPIYKNGDTVFIRFQDDVDDGQIAAVIVDDSATLKRVYHTAKGVNLVSENPDYPTMVFTSENSDSIRIIGLAVGYLRWTE